MRFTLHRLSHCLSILLSLLALFTPLGHGAETFSTTTLVIDNRTPMLATSSVLKPDFIVQPASRKFTGSTRTELINYLSSGNRGLEGYYIDGETWHATQSLSFGFDTQSTVTLELPWLKHHKGISDNFIYRFHDVLQLPQNGRTPDRQDYQLWDLRVDGKTILHVEDSQSGLGDVRVRWQQALESGQFGLAVKLPTGDFDKQTGSEKFDVGVSFAQQNPSWFRQRDMLADCALALWYGVSLNYVQINDLLADALDTKPWILAARAGFGWQVSPRWILKTQLDANSPFFDSEIRELGWVPLLIGFGSETRLSANSALEFMIIEDLRPRTSPDVVLSLGVRYGF